MMSMESANSVLYLVNVPTQSSTFVARARTAVAGAVIKAVAALALLALLGARDEEATAAAEAPKRARAPRGGEAAAGGGAAAGRGAPPHAGVAVAESRAVGVRPGRVEEAPPPGAGFTGGPRVSAAQV
jgi:hypothetical protein